MGYMPDGGIKIYVYNYYRLAVLIEAIWVETYFFFIFYSNITLISLQEMKKMLYGKRLFEISTAAVDQFI